MSEENEQRRMARKFRRFFLFLLFISGCGHIIYGRAYNAALIQGIYVDIPSTDKVDGRALAYKSASGGTFKLLALGAGDVVGPGSATDNAIVRFDTTTGKLIQNSVVTIDDAGAATGFNTLNASGQITGGTLTQSGSTTRAGAIKLTSETSGDTLYQDGTGWSRLPKGSNGNVLTLTAGLPAWAAPAGGGNVTGPGSSTNRAIPSFNGTGGTALFDNANDVIDASGNVSVSATLAADTVNQTKSSATVGAINLTSQATGDLLGYSSGWVRIPIGSASAVLQVSGGVAAWTLTPSGLTSISANTVTQAAAGSHATAINLTSQAKGDLLGTAGTTWDRLSVGSNNQILIADSAQALGIKWAAASSVSVVGPGSSTDRTIPTWSGTGGNTLRDNPNDAIDASGNVTINATLAGATLSQTNTSSTAGAINITSQATGDLLYYSAGWIRKAIGSTSAILQVSGGIPSWTLTPSGLTSLSAGTLTQSSATSSIGAINLSSQAKGDVAAFDGSNWVRLGVGSNTQVLTADSTQTAGIKWAAAGGGTLPDLQTFTSGGTWTKPSGAHYCRILIIAGGGGGASGRRGAASSTRGGGGGGCGASLTIQTVSADQFGATETVTIGAAGAGGTAPSADSTDGNGGGNGGTSNFGSNFKANGGNGGSAGTSAGGGAGASNITAGGFEGVSLISSPNAAGSGGTNTGASAPGNINASRGTNSGGGGGGVSSGNARGDGAAGGGWSAQSAGGGVALFTNAISGGSAGTGAGASGGSPSSNPFQVGGGGGGGAGNDVNGGGQGGDATGFGGGGGGGGGGTNGSSTARGGNGTAGYVSVLTW